MNFEKVLAVAALCFITTVVLVLVSTPFATGYELSIYDAYPSFFWFALVATIVCGIAIVLLQAFAITASKWWMIGIAIIIVGNSIFLLLPTFRGYALYGRGDTLDHLGWTKDILTTGYVEQGDFYPIVHILMFAFVQIAGLPLEALSALLCVIFSGLYILGVYLLAKTITKQFGQALVVTAFASPLTYSILHANILPSTFSFFMVPLLFYFFLKAEVLRQNRLENIVLLYLFVFFITFAHPMTTLFVLAFFITFGVASELYLRVTRRERLHTNGYDTAKKNVLYVILVLFAAFFVWYLSYAFFQTSFKEVFEWLVYGTGLPLYQKLLSPLSGAGAQLTFGQIFELFVSKYGTFSILVITAMVASSFVFCKTWSRRREFDSVGPMRFVFAMEFFVGLLVGAVVLFGHFIVSESNPLRIFSLSILTGTIICGVVVYDFLRASAKVKFGKIVSLPLLGAILIVMVVLSMGSVYGSQRTMEMNSQITKMDIAGVYWFGKSKSTYPLMENNIGVTQLFENYLFGYGNSLIPLTNGVYQLPSHLVFNETGNLLKNTNSSEAYIIIFGADKIEPLLFPGNVRSLVHQYTSDDFARLASDPRADRIYCNGEFESWMIHS